VIIRVPHRRKYTVIADAALRDSRLSFRATGVLAYLLSFPDGTEFSGRRLAQVKAEGRDAILKAMDELHKAGYLQRERSQLLDGRWTTTVTILELPSPENPDSVWQENGSPSPEKPDAGKPGPGKPDSKASSTEEEVPIGTTPGNPTPIWAQQPMWQDDKGRWFVGPRPEEEAS
jgi:hypothetical protein